MHWLDAANERVDKGAVRCYLLGSIVAIVKLNYSRKKRVCIGGSICIDGMKILDTLMFDWAVKKISYGDRIIKRQAS
jgi:hypothetical protein